MDLEAPRTVQETPRLLKLDYAPEVPDAALVRLERIGREAGLPLAQLELLGQDATACWEFAHLAETISLEGAILSTDWARLEAILRARTSVSACSASSGTD